MEALVIVHLSSLDAYAQMAEEIQGDQERALDRAFWIERAIMEHRGPVFIVDQDWELHPRFGAPREELLRNIRFRKGVTWVEFDEDLDAWGPFLKRLERALRAADVTRVKLGGFWFDRTMKTGCVSRVYDYLKKRGWNVRAGRDIVGCETDFEPE